MKKPIDWDQNVKGGNTSYVTIGQLYPGLRLVGMLLPEGGHYTVERIEYRGEHQLGNAIERQRYAIHFRHGGEPMIVGGDHRFHVLKPLEAA